MAGIEINMPVKGIADNGEVLFGAEDVMREIQLIIDGNAAECAAYRFRIDELKTRCNELAAQVEQLSKSYAACRKLIRIHGKARAEAHLAAEKANFKLRVYEENKADHDRETAARAVATAINACEYCGADGQAWRSELEQHAMKIRAGEVEP